MGKLLAVLAALFACAMPAHSQQLPCNSYQQIIANITGPNFKERKVATAQTKIGAEGAPITIEVYASPKGKTFSILLIRPDGFTCILVAGGSLQTFPLPVEGTEI